MAVRTKLAGTFEAAGAGNRHQGNPESVVRKNLSLEIPTEWVIDAKEISDATVVRSTKCAGLRRDMTQMANEGLIGKARPIRVLLADDHKLVRAGFRAMLDSLGGIEIVGETGDGHEALELIRTRHPDVALLDITMPGLTGIEVAMRVVNEAPNVRVIILSMHTSEDYIARAVRAGVSGYLLKNADPVELELALRAAMNREIYFSPAVSKQLVQDYTRRLGRDEEPLTARQREVLQAIAEGKSTKEIALMLDLSVKTVETHRKELMERLGIHDVPGLVRYAIRVGLIKA